MLAYVLGLALVVAWVWAFVAFTYGAQPSPSPSPSPLAPHTRDLLYLYHRRDPLTGTRSLAARLAGYGIGDHADATVKGHSMRAVSASLRARGVYGPVPSGCYTAFHTPTTPRYPFRFASRSTVGNAAGIGGAFIGGDAA